MKGRTFYFSFLVLLVSAGFSVHSLAQTITTGALGTTTLCQGSGGSVTVPFSVSGTFNSGNIFTAQLSDATGSFASTTTAVGTISGLSGGSISATIPAGITAGSAYRIRVVSSSPAKIGSNSTNTLTINAAPAAPGVTNPPAYCQGATPQSLSATPTAGGTLNWYGNNASGGTASSTPTVPSTNNSDTYYVSQTVGGCEGPRASISVTVNSKPAAPGTSPVSYCVGQTASILTATPTGGTLNWYTVAIGGTASGSAPVPSTSAPGATSYYVSQTINGCEGPRATLVVTVNAIPAAPTSSASTTYCQNQSAIQLIANGSNLSWYGTNASGGTASSVAPTPSTSTANTTTYYVSQSVSGCESPRTGIAITVKAQPDLPTTTTPSPYCQNQTASALVATAALGGTLNWYGTNASGGTASSNPTVPSTVNSNTYYVSQTVNGCESGRAAISVTIKPTPGAPGVTSSIIACQNRGTDVLTATPSSGGTLNWYTVAIGGTASTSPPTPPTNTVGSTAYYVSQSINGCEGSRATITVTVNAVPAPPSVTNPSPYCKNYGSVSLGASAQGTSLLWYGNATGGTGSSVAPIPSTGTPGSTSYYVTQTVSSCESDRATIVVQVKDTPDAPVVSGIEFCQGYTAPTLTATFTNNTTPNWYGTNASGGTASASAPTPPNNTVGTTYYYVSQTLNGCESPRASLSVRVKATPGAPGVTNVSYCNFAQPQPLTASGINLKWYDASGNLQNGVPTLNTTSVGTQTYGVTQTSNEGCESGKSTIIVTIKPLPSPPGVSNIVYCQAQQDQPAQNVVPVSAIGQDLRWYNTDGNQFSSAPTPSISNTASLTFLVTQTVNGCESSKAPLQVNIVTLAAPTVAKSVVTYCVDALAYPLQATGDPGSTLKWIDPYGNITNQAPTPLTLNTSIDPLGDKFYVYQIGANGCYSPRATIRSIVNAPPTLSLIAPTQVVNLGQRAPLELKFTSAGPFSYTVTGGYSGTTAATDTTISVLPRGNTLYQVIAVSNGCGTGLPGNPATAQINVQTPTVSTGSLSSSTLCAGTSVTVPFTTTGQFNNGNAFRIELVSVSDTTKKYLLTTSATSSPVTAPISVSQPGGLYYVHIKADNPEIAITGSNSPSQLNVRPLASAVLTGTQNIYQGVPANLTITLGGDGPWSIAYADSLRNYAITTSTNPYLAEVRPTKTTTYRLVSVTNNCGSGPISGTATVSVLPLLGVDDNPLDPLVKTYPVPTQTVLMVELDLPLARDPAILSLTDLSGRPVLQQTSRVQSNTLDLSAQPNGLYLLRIQVGDKQTVRKILKQ